MQLSLSLSCLLQSNENIYKYNNQINLLDNQALQPLPYLLTITAVVMILIYSFSINDSVAFH